MPEIPLHITPAELVDRLSQRLKAANKGTVGAYLVSPEDNPVKSLISNIEATARGVLQQTYKAPSPPEAVQQCPLPIGLTGYWCDRIDALELDMLIRPTKK